MGFRVPAFGAPPRTASRWDRGQEVPVLVAALYTAFALLTAV